MISRLLRHAAGIKVLVLKGTEALAGAAMTIYLARILGPTEFGVFAFGLATIMLLAIPIKNGASTLITKHVAIAREENGAEQASPLLKTGIRLSLIYASAIIMALWGVMMISDSENVFIASVAVFSLVLPFLCVTGLMEGVLRGSFRPNAAILVGTVLVPLLVLGVAFLLTEQMRAEGWAYAVYLYIGAGAAITILSITLAWPYLRTLFSQHDGSSMNGTEWLSLVAPFAIVTGLLIFNRQIDTILLGTLAGEKEAGIYRIAAQASVLVTFGMQAIGHLYAPYLATADKAAASSKISGYLRKSVLFSVAFGGLALITLALWGDEVIRLLAGPEYLEAYPVMLVLCTANLAVAVNGATMQALYMQGHQKRTAWIFFAAGVLSVIANASLIPYLGINGAAIATSTAIVTWSLGLRWLACDVWQLSFLTLSPRLQEQKS
ncbi:oligosaccharide flippase family protein [Pseudovibrio sp. JE062]|uniref:oligosaccharide flippase family protein n=1 Tax=Pseudovibrio sp. JE062 TaxID=439495 RepID=UPI000186C717|nr:oligosaccharide flippase family protein [Pseudovibrio sp. JE062]EEA96267.1 Polysaccharide biosynthesis protein [Pseudovibrio sp. JE062]